MALKINPKKHAEIFFLLAIFLIVKLFLLFRSHVIIWDEAVYIGMGKYLFSFGKLGLWEHIRPVLWPIILGFSWRINLDPVITGRLLELLFSFGIICLVYLIGVGVFDKKAALLASILITFSPVFFFLSFYLFTEIPAVFFVLLSLLFFLGKKSYLSGLMIGLAFLTKFPAAIFLFCLIPFLKNYKKVYLILGFLTVVTPFLIFNYLMYGSFLSPLVDAMSIITKVLGCNLLSYQPWYYYFITIYRENFLYLFSVIGLFLSLRKLDKKKGLLLLFLAVPLIYFIHLHCRDYRYLMLFIPFVALFTGYGVSFLTSKFDKRIFYLITLLFLFISAYSGINFYLQHEVLSEPDVKKDYYRYLEGKAIDKEVWISNPLASVYTPKKVNLIYYPVYDYSLAKSFSDYLVKNSSRISYVFLDNCGGGIICAPDDKLCSKETISLLDYLHLNFRKVYDKEIGKCYYYIFKEK
jgi:4-amino-4-deoxy-L-arabinose transferase-like glycosyltransferase